MKKIVSLMAGAAVLALAAPAVAAGPVNQGAVTVIGTDTTLNDYGLATLGWGADALARFFGGEPNFSVFTINSGGFQGNNGTVGAASATFSLTGLVQGDCSYYSGDANTNRTIDFGVIGINAVDTNANAAFHMAGNAPTVNIDTNLAGCNLKNRVTVTKANMKNASATGQGFDPAQFTDELRVRARARYTAGAVGQTTGVATQTYIDAGYGAAGGSSEHGAWKSPMYITLNIEDPNKALVAGTYSGSVSVALAAF